MVQVYYNQNIIIKTVDMTLCQAQPTEVVGCPKKVDLLPRRARMSEHSKEKDREQCIQDSRGILL